MQTKASALADKKSADDGLVKLIKTLLVPLEGLLMGLDLLLVEIHFLLESLPHLLKLFPFLKRVTYVLFYLLINFFVIIID